VLTESRRPVCPPWLRSASGLRGRRLRAGTTSRAHGTFSCVVRGHPALLAHGLYAEPWVVASPGRTGRGRRAVACNVPIGSCDPRGLHACTARAAWIRRSDDVRPARSSHAAAAAFHAPFTARAP